MSDTWERHIDAVRALVSRLSCAAAIVEADGRLLLHNEGFSDTIIAAENGLDGMALSSLIQGDAMPVSAFLSGQGCTDDGLTLQLLTRNGVSDFTLHALMREGSAALYLCQPAPLPSSTVSRSRFLMEHLDQGIWDHDIQKGTFVASDGWRRMRGRCPKDVQTKPSPNWIEDIHPDDRQPLMDVFESQVRGESDTISIQYRHWHPEGHWFWVLCQAKVMEVGPDHRPTRIVGTDTDISLIKQNEIELQQLTSKLQLAIEAAGMGIWDYDPATCKVHWDDRMLEIYGLTDGNNHRSENLWETYIHPDDLDETKAYADHCQKNNLGFNRDYRVIRQDGAVRHVRSLARVVRTTKTESKLIGVNIDVTEDYQRAEELETARRKLEYDSRHDALTGLANRRLLDESSTQLFKDIRADQRYAVLHVDLDHFKQINDTLGHAAGDAVLVHVATHLKEIIGAAGLVSRVGGDEFVA
ncbi:MAG: PAS domain-containing protein, partial [Pseudomonadota bacterium]